MATFNDSPNHLMNTTVTTTRLAVFLCPSDMPPGYVGDKLAGTAPGNSYFESVGSGLEWDATKTAGPPNGMFMVGGPAIGIRDVLDGTTNTIAFGEWQIGDGNVNKLSVPSDLIYVGQFPQGVKQNTPQMELPAMGATAFQQWTQACAAGLQGDRGAQTPYVGQYWALGCLIAEPGQHPAGPQSRRSRTVPRAPLHPTTSPRPAMVTLSSRHPGGANVLMCDGSVRFLKDSTNLNTIWSLGSRNQGEVVSADSF